MGRYNGCGPSAEKGKGRLCATEVDSQGNLKKWARCNKYCGSSSGKFVVCKAAGQGKNFERSIGVTEDCLFPFKHNAKLYTGCVPSIDGKGPWCATKVNNKGIMQRWARCNEVCNTDKGTHQTCKANGQGEDYIKKGDAQNCLFPFIHNNK